MTQAQVAGEDVTGAYVSRIESGGRRPDVHLLERMAGRLRIRLEDLVADVLPAEKAALELALGDAEVALRRGEARQALELVDEVIFNPVTNRADAAVLRRAHWVRAPALAACGVVSGATAILEDLSATSPERPEAENLTILATLAQCYLATGVLEQAQRIATRAAEIEAVDGPTGHGQGHVVERLGRAVGLADTLRGQGYRRGPEGAARSGVTGTVVTNLPDRRVALLEVRDRSGVGAAGDAVVAVVDLHAHPTGNALLARKEPAQQVGGRPRLVDVVDSESGVLALVVANEVVVGRESGARDHLELFDRPELRTAAAPPPS
ncbi:helix-turn-helix domain-containing protein [Nocardioides sp. LML1-1-1.1]